MIIPRKKPFDGGGMAQPGDFDFVLDQKGRRERRVMLNVALQIDPQS
jgi:hypothetical protein